jgi:hypothetical protein
MQCVSASSAHAWMLTRCNTTAVLRQGRVEEDYLSRLHAAMTTIRGINRTNVLTLGRIFKSVAGIMQVLLHAERWHYKRKFLTPSGWTIGREDVTT